MKPLKIILILSFLILSLNPIFSQRAINTHQFETSKIYLLQLQDGTQFIGNFLSRDSLNIVISSLSIPKVEIPIGRIKHFEEVNPKNIRNGEYWFPNPNATRYLFAPSAFTLKKGEGYYQNTYLFLNSLNVGITDHISIGGGIEFLSTFSSLSEGSFQPVIFITPKIGFQVAEKVHVGAGLLYASIPDMFDNERSGLGIAYGIGTYGTEEHNLTIGLGWGFIEKEFSSKPFVVISGMTRTGRKTALVTENWFVPADPYVGIISYGIRFFGEKLTVDLALINNRDIAEEFIIGIPYVDFVVKF